MKKYLGLFLMLFACITLHGQDKEIIKKKDRFAEKSFAEPQKETRTRKKRIPDSEQPNYITFQLGFAANISETVGFNATISFERKIERLPLAWFANYTFGYVREDTYQDSDEHVDGESINYFSNTSKETKDLSISYHHIGGGLHYYFREYNKKLKLFTGMGAFIGLNHHEIEFETDGNIDGNGLDLGVYGIFGMRWCRRHVKVGFEYRFGYVHTTIFNENESGRLHELCFCIGVQY